MTSLRFEYTTAQEAEMFKRVIQNEDRLRSQFASGLPACAKKVWRGFDGDFTAALNNLQQQEQSPVASPTHQGRSVQLFSKKMRRVPPQSTLPPLTHLTLDKNLVVDADNDKPNLKVHEGSRYSIPLRRQQASTQTSSPLTGIPSSVQRAIPQPPVVDSNPIATPSGKSKTTAQSFDTASSVFSRGSSSFAGPKAKPGLPRGGTPSTSGPHGSTPTSQLAASLLAASNKTASQAKTSSTQREKLRSMSERLSRVEERIEESIAEEAKVTQTLEELKQIVLHQNNSNSGAATQ